MIALRLTPRATRIEGGGWRPEVLIEHASGDQSVFHGHSAPSQNAALEVALRLAATAMAGKPVTFEVPFPWK
jgi:hypothetical protein